MKIDCSIAKNYIIEKSKMTKNCTIACGNCPFYLKGVKYDDYRDCKSFERANPEKAVEIVQNWSNEYSQITFMEYFKKYFPKAELLGTPCVRQYFGEEIFDKNICDNDCTECWYNPIPKNLLEKLEVTKNDETDEN